MPKKILRKYNFTERPGKGSHTNWIYPDYSGRATIPGKDGSDAKKYLEKEVGKAIAQIKIKRKNG